MDRDKLTKEGHTQLQVNKNLGMTERKKVVKKLQFEFHPDKHPGREDEYTHAFQYLMQNKEWFLITGGGGIGGSRRNSGSK